MLVRATLLTRSCHTRVRMRVAHMPVRVALTWLRVTRSHARACRMCASASGCGRAWCACGVIMLVRAMLRTRSCMPRSRAHARCAYMLVRVALTWLRVTRSHARACYTRLEVTRMFLVE